MLQIALKYTLPKMKQEVKEVEDLPLFVLVFFFGVRDNSNYIRLIFWMFSQFFVVDR